MRRSSPDASLVALARLTRPVGLLGGLRVQLLCDSPERLLHVQEFFLGSIPGEAEPVVVREVSVRGNGVVVFLQGCETRSDAETLRGKHLFISSSESVPSPDGKARVHELVGCTVETQDGRRMGTVAGVYDLPAQRVLGVARQDGTEVLVPDVDAWILNVDTGKRRVVLTSAELFDEL